MRYIERDDWMPFGRMSFTYLSFCLWSSWFVWSMTVVEFMCAHVIPFIYFILCHSNIENGMKEKFQLELKVCTSHSFGRVQYPYSNLPPIIKGHTLDCGDNYKTSHSFCYWSILVKKNKTTKLNKKRNLHMLTHTETPRMNEPTSHPFPTMNMCVRLFSSTKMPSQNCALFGLLQWSFSLFFSFPCFAILIL